MERKSTANIGGFYPMNQYRFVPFKQAPIAKPEPRIPMGNCGGNPIAALEEPLPPVVNETFVPNVPLTKDEVDLRRYQVEVEREEKEKQREQKFIFELQGRVNTDERQKQDYNNLVERKITELAGSNMPISEKILAIQELMTSADRMGLNPQVASPMLLEALQRFGMSAGFAGIIDQLQQNQQIAEQAPQQPLLSSDTTRPSGLGQLVFPTDSGYSGSYRPSEVGRSMGWDTMDGGLEGGAGHNGSDMLNPEEYYESIRRQAVARPSRLPVPSSSYGESGLAPTEETDEGLGRIVGWDTDRGPIRVGDVMRKRGVRGHSGGVINLDTSREREQGAGESGTIGGGLPAPLDVGGGGAGLPVPSTQASRKSAADILQHGEDDGDGIMGVLRRMRRNRARAYGMDET